MRLRLRFTAALALLLVALAAANAQAAPPATAARTCKPVTIESRLAAIATVLTARNMTCARARTVIRRNGREASKDADAFRKGGRFRLGAFRCRVYYKVEEANRARCVRGARVFRVDYGS
jgi:hypothetical protein